MATFPVSDGFEIVHIILITFTRLIVHVEAPTKTRPWSRFVPAMVICCPARLIYVGVTPVIEGADVRVVTERLQLLQGME